MPITATPTYRRDPCLIVRIRGCFQVSLGLGSLLAMTVLLGIVAGAMPKSNAIPLLGRDFWKRGIS